MFNFLKNIYFWIIVVFLFLIFSIIQVTAAQRDNITLVEKAIRDTYTPLQSGVHGLRDKISIWGTAFQDKTRMEEQIADLEQLNLSLSIENQKLREFASEARRLEEILNFKEKRIDDYELLTAMVIARSPNNWYRGITVDKGIKDGVESGMAVISPLGLVGKVASVSQNSAQISLITDREIAVGVILQRTRETSGIVQGIGENDLLRMINIPYYASINTQDVVVTSGLSDIYPKGIDVGTVEEFEREPNGLLLNAAIKPKVDFNRLEEVLIVLSEKTTGESNGND